MSVFQPLKQTALALFIVVFLSACETVENRRDMLDKQTELKGHIKDGIGVDSLVGFNLDGGVLIDVSVAFDADAVADRTVSELRRVVRHGVKNTFKTPPRAIYVQLFFEAQTP
ncbi:MAG: hypothetical protein AAF353_02800 [Pseudomonadota bacterium]